MKKKVIIIGAGVGGLAAAARCASKGFAVNVFEKLPRCGGRNNIIEDRGFKFDTGPSFVLMPDFFEEVFGYCNRRLSDYLDLKVLDTSYRIFYPDGETLTVYADSNKTKEELERIEKGASVGFDDFINETSRLYQELKPFLYRGFSSAALFDWRYWPLLKKLRIGESYWQLASRFFKTEKLRFAFTFEAMFMGVSPYQAPGFYSIISFADHVQKIRHPMGGMYEIPLALERMAKEFGATFHYSEEVAHIHRNGGLAVKTGRETYQADYLVVNADYPYAQTDLLHRRIPAYTYSCSVYLLYWGLKKNVTGLAHHNLFFSRDMKKNLSQIFHDKVVPDDPSFYIHVPTVTDPSLAWPGRDILYVLIPVPNLQGATDDFRGHEERLKSIVLDKIKKVTGQNIEESIEAEHKFYPQDFIDRYNIKYGATFGLAHNLMQSAFFRPANVDRRIKNLFFAGASTQPGGGLPVVIASSRIVADLIQQARG